MKQRTQKNGFLVASILLIVLAFAVSMFALVWAKYISREKKDTVVAAKAFYFESDLLTEKGATYTLAPGTTKIDIVLKNYADDLRWSEVDVRYDVTLNGSAVQEQLILKTGKQENSKVTITGLTPGTYTVVAKATSPYSKTLKATFVIPATTGGVYYSVSDAAGSPVLRLTVRTEDYAGNVTLSWPTGVSPDNTDPLLAGATGTSCTVRFENDSEYTFLFFKSDPSQVYDKTHIKADAAN